MRRLAGLVAWAVLAAACQRVDPCASHPCLGAGQVCAADGATAACVCPAGTFAQQGGCQARTPCLPNPCTAANQTTCLVEDGGASCGCNPGFAPLGAACATTPSWDCGARHAGATDGEAEPDECPPLASALSAGVPASRTLSPAGDHDWFLLLITPGAVQRLRVGGDADTPSLLVEVFAADGLSVLGADTRGAPSAEVTFLAPPGPVYARVRAGLPGGTGPYQVVLSDLGGDDFPADPSAAPILRPDAVFEGEVQYAGDRDAVRLALPGQTAVRLSAGSAGNLSAEVEVEVLAADGGLLRTLRWVGRDGRAPDGGPVHSLEGDVVTLFLPADGELALVARGRAAADTGRFAVEVHALGPDDYPDDRAWALPVVLDGGVTAARFERPDDVDVLTFAQHAGNAYTVRCQSSVGGTCLATAVGAGGTVLAPSVGTPWLAETSEEVVVTLASAGYPGAQAYVWQVLDLGPDDYPAAPGAPILVGTELQGQLVGSNDVDTFVFPAVEGHVFQVLTGPAPFLPLVTVQDPSGAEVATGAVRFLAGASGAFRVTLRRSSWLEPDGYTLLVLDLGTDDVGNTAATAAALRPEVPVAGALEYQGDVDAYTFTPTPGHVYWVSCAVGAEACRVTARDGLGLAQLLPVVPGGFLAGSPGPWTLELSSVSGGLGGYELLVSDLGPEDHGDSRASATPLAVGAPIAGRVGYALDHDLFAFSTVEGHVYEVTCATDGGCLLLATDGQGRPLAGSANGVLGHGTFLAPATQLSYLDLSGASPGAPFDYTLVVADRGTDDHGGTRATASPLTPGTPVSGQVQYPGDLDDFLVTLSAGELYRATCSGCQLAVFGPDGAPAPADGVAPGVVELKAWQGGAYLLQVTAPRPPLAYTLTLASLGADDHGDTPATATPLTIGAPPLGGLIEVTGDVDVFSFVGTPGHVVGVSCISLTGPQCSLQVRGAALGETASGGAFIIGGSFLVTAGTPLTVEVSMARGAYTVSVSDLGPDVVGDDPAHATPLALGTAVDGVLESRADIDVYAVDLVPGQAFIELIGGPGTQVTVTSATLGLVATGYAGWLQPFTVPATGTYAFSVSLQPTAAPDPAHYSLGVVMR